MKWMGSGILTIQAGNCLKCSASIGVLKNDRDVVMARLDTQKVQAVESRGIFPVRTYFATNVYLKHRCRRPRP